LLPLIHFTHLAPISRRAITAISSTPRGIAALTRDQGPLGLRERTRYGRRARPAVRCIAREA